MHFWQSSMPQASESSMPLALQMFTAQIFIPLLLSYLGLRGPDFWDRDCRVSHSFRAGFPQWELGLGFFITSSLPTSPDVSWAEVPHALLSPVHLQWWSAPPHCLSSACDGGAHCLGQPVGCPAKVVRLLLFFHRDKSIFVQLCGQPSGGWPTAYCWWLCLCHQP